MMTIPIFWVIVLIVILHTVLQHLLSWASRSKAVVKDDGLSFLVYVGWVLEAAILFLILHACLTT